MLSYYLSLLATPEDKQLFSELFEKNNRNLEKYVLYLTKNQHDAEDAMQNTYVKIIDHFADIYNVPDSKRFAWMKVVAKNEVQMIFRDNKRPMTARKLVPTRSTYDMEDILNESALLRVFKRLPEIYQETLELRLISRYSSKEVAAHLGITVETVNTRVCRGKALLKKHIIKEGLYQ